MEATSASATLPAVNGALFVEFFLPGQPRGKAKRFGHGRGFNDPKTEKYMRDLGWVAKAAMHGRAPLTGAVGLYVFAGFEIPKSWSAAKQALAITEGLLPTGKPDGDNIIKMIGDSCKGIVWRDDAIITDFTFSKRYAEKPGLDVRVQTIFGKPE